MKHGRGYVYDLYYHIVWCVKYRREILVDDIKDDFLDIISNICKNNNYELVEINTDKDHVHMLLGLSPQDSIPVVMKTLKGVSARLLNQKHKDKISNDYKLKSATLSETPSGKYFVSLLFEYYEEETNINIDENKILGLDYSMKELFVTDDMIEVNDKYLRLYRKYEERLHFLQKALCRRQRPNHKKGIKSSKRYDKLRKQTAALFEHMKNIRLDYYNKLSK